jgi:hypothetical protein
MKNELTGAHEVIMSIETPEAGSPSLNNLLCERIAKWEVEADFLDNPHDSDTDRACGRTYRQCAKELRVILGL